MTFRVGDRVRMDSGRKWRGVVRSLSTAYPDVPVLTVEWDNERTQTINTFMMDLVHDNTEPWRSVRDDPPPRGLVVEVENNGGAHLIRDGNLWWLPDMSMYVYYTPTQWREVK